MITKNTLTGIRDFFYLISEGAFGIVANLVVLILVGRHYGETGLGVFSYLLSLYFIIGFLSDFGIPKYVEYALTTGQVKEQVSRFCSYAFQSILLLSFFFGSIMILAALFDPSLTRVDEKIAAYIILGLTLPFRNLTRLLLSLLETKSGHHVTAGLKMRKRLILLGGIYLLLLINIPPSFLLIGYLLSELGTALTAWKKNTPSLSLTPWVGRRNLRIILKHSSPYLFTDDILDVVLYLDFFLLGFFIPSEALGIYAEASILARTFLIIPFALKALFYTYYCRLVSEDKNQQAAVFFHKSTAILFFVHASFCLYFLIYYPTILRRLFYAGGYHLESFRIFSILLPGLLLFSIFSIHETVYEVQDRVRYYQKIVLFVSVMNVVLNAFLIPFAGFIGAAWATTVSLFIYFFLFGKGLGQLYKIRKKTYLLASGGIYFLYTVFNEFEPGLLIYVWMIPLSLFIILLLLNFFHFEELYV